MRSFKEFLESKNWQFEQTSVGSVAPKAPVTSTPFKSFASTQKTNVPATPNTIRVVKNLLSKSKTPVNTKLPDVYKDPQVQNLVISGDPSIDMTLARIYKK